MDFLELVDLASERLGGSVLYATDDYFAGKENLLKPHAAVWKEHEYTDRGKWMDGWESRRKRIAPDADPTMEGATHDFAIIRLGAPGIVRGVVVDTAFFRGNYPEHCSIEGCVARPETGVDALLGAETEWIEILQKQPLRGDSQNLFAIGSPVAFTHLRLRIHPDGGVARFRVHGEVVPEWRRSGGLTNELDLAAIEHGGEVLTCSDMFFGPKHNLIMPGRAHNMSDGWETKRRRGPGHDWVIVQLATEAVVKRVELDTAHFKGNFPDTASIDASNGGEEYVELLPRTKLLAHTRHLFTCESADELRSLGPVTHLRLNVYPDGGVSRMRVHALATERGRAAAAARHLNTRTEEDARRELTACCGSSRWVQQMIAARPFDDLLATADAIWNALSPDDWREAFAAHPRIGEKKADRFSGQEQSGASDATAATMSELAEVNRQYEQRFGTIYIVCATGKSAEEMLAIARQRLGSTPADELRVAAGEQRKITRLRLLKLVS
jgi:allantoicase